MKFKSLIIFIHLSCGLFSFSIQGSISSLSLSNIKHRIDSQSDSISLLNKKISKLELTLGSKNKRYLSILNLKNKIRDEIWRTSEWQKRLKSKIEKKNLIIKSHLRGLLIYKLNKKQSASDLYTRSYLDKTLKGKVKKINKLFSLEKQLSQQIKELSNRYREYQVVESELYSFIFQMEKRKNKLASSYLEHVKKREVLQGRVKKTLGRKRTKLKKIFTKLVESDIHKSPVAKYSSMDHGKKGINFKFRGRVPITASKSGKVIHVGPLANYGTVVMIDHGLERRTVFLGQLEPKVKKGQHVKTGQKIAMTHPDRSQRGQIYFEVRIKNIAKNTYKYLDKKTLSKL